MGNPGNLKEKMTGRIKRLSRLNKQVLAIATADTAD